MLRGFTGFGGALAMAPVFALLLGPAAALGTIVTVNLLTCWQMLGSSWRAMQRSLVLPMTIAAVVATPLGLAAVLWLDPGTARRLIGGAVVISGLALLAGWRRTGSARLGGALNGLAGIGGPPAALWLLAGREGAVRDRAGLIVYVALTQVATAAAAALAGVLVPEALLRGLWLAPLYIVGTWIGAALFRRAPERAFRAAAVGTVLVLVLGCLAVIL